MHEARREAVANARRLKLALEVAQAGVYEIDHVARSFWASPELLRLAGAEGASYAEVTRLRYPRFHPDDLPLVRESFIALHQGSKRSGEGFEARIYDPDGRERWVRIFHQLQVARNGRWLKAVGLVHDIDADKRQELALIEAQRAAEDAGEAKAAFLANMSHEIRTPMNGVLGVLQILKAEPLTPEGRTLLDEALSCGRMLAELLNDVIDFSKIEAGRLELAYEPLHPKSVIEGVIHLLRPQADGKGLSLVGQCDPAVGWVRSDPVRLRQALFNLIGNAVKFTEAGGVTVRCMPGAAGRLRFEVEDTGIGIPAASQARVFERFDQGDASTTRRFGGSGLGLSITRRLAELMGGEVGFSSTVGAGSTFWIEILAPPAGEVQPATAQPLHDVLYGLRVLVVEDNATNRIIATKLLEQLGASVETAADGYLGLEAAAQGGFDLILMDVQMPGMDGLETTRRLRALGPPVSQTPIVALTANVLSHQRQAYLEAGMDGVVGKPISPSALLAEIARLSGSEPAAGQAVA
jgi:PAS domain S-box-containing protein